MFHSKQLLRGLSTACDECVMVRPCNPGAPPCEYCRSNNIPCTLTPGTPDRTRNGCSLQTRTTPLFFPIQGSAYTDRISLSARVNHPSGRPPTDLPSEESSIGISPIAGFYTLWSEYPALAGDTHDFSMLLDALHHYTAYTFSDVSYRSVCDTPDPVFKEAGRHRRGDWRWDMFYSLDGDALVALGLLVVELLCERYDVSVDDSQRLPPPFVQAPRTRAYLADRGSLIGPRNYYTRRRKRVKRDDVQGAL